MPRVDLQDKEMKMDRIGLSFEEYAELKVRPRVGADTAFGHAAEMALAEMFPMTLVAASSHLRSRGYDCRPAMLEVLVRDGVVTPAAPDAWSRADVDAAARHFEDCDLLTPYAAMCQTLGCRYVWTCCGRCARRRIASRPGTGVSFPTTTSTLWCIGCRRAAGTAVTTRSSASRCATTSGSGSSAARRFDPKMTSEPKELELTPDLLEYAKAVALKEARRRAGTKWGEQRRATSGAAAV